MAAMGSAQQIWGVPSATPVLRAVLMVSLDQDKVNRLKVEEWAGKAREMARVLRGLRYPMEGVRQVEAIVFRYWREGGKVLASAPWQPVGALVVVEGTDADDLERKVNAVWAAAGSVDQGGPTTRAVDNW